MNRNVNQIASGSGLILSPYVRPNLTSANSGGMIITSSNDYAGYPNWQAMDGDATSQWITVNGYTTGWLNALFDKQLFFDGKNSNILLVVNSDSVNGRAAQTALYTDSTRTKALDGVQTFANAQWATLTFKPSSPILTKNILFDIQSGYGTYVGFSNIIFNNVFKVG